MCQFWSLYLFPTLNHKQLLSLSCAYHRQQVRDDAQGDDQNFYFFLASVGSSPKNAHSITAIALKCEEGELVRDVYFVLQKKYPQLLCSTGDWDSEHRNWCWGTTRTPQDSGRNQSEKNLPKRTLPHAISLQDLLLVCPLSVRSSGLLAQRMISRWGGVHFRKW